MGQTVSQVMVAFQEGLIRLHHEERHCWIGKNERLLLEVLKTGRRVGERQRAWKCAAVATSTEHFPMKQTQERLSELGVVAYWLVYGDFSPTLYISVYKVRPLDPILS
jgi:hypothetical protein